MLLSWVKTVVEDCTFSSSQLGILLAKELSLCCSVTFILLYFEGGFAVSVSSQKGNFKCLGKLSLGLWTYQI